MSRFLPAAGAVVFVFLVFVAASLLQPVHIDAASRPMCLGKRATIVGSGKANTLLGTKKADVIVGLGGNDRILGGEGADRICGGTGNDRINSGRGDDRMNGGKGSDECWQKSGGGTRRNCEGPLFQLEVLKAGTGTGTVISAPTMIHCGQTCAGSFFEAEVISLTASAGAGSTFAGWGGACTGLGSCAVRMLKPESVTATFSASPSPAAPLQPPPGPSPPSPSCAARCYAVSRTGEGYQAVSPTTGRSFHGGLKSVVESAVYDLDSTGGGTVAFQGGVFDLGATYFRLVGVADITIQGQGVDATIIQNSSTDPQDTEPFNTQGLNRVVIRDLTVTAGGTPRTTSDAIDMDNASNSIIERVKITYSRGKGIIFDGKDAGWNSEGNTVRDCVVTGTRNDGIQLLASSRNRVERCTITDTVGDGIDVRKAQTIHAQPNKKSTDNLIIGNVIDNAGDTGIRVHSSDRNLISGNRVTNSSDDVANQDGIRIASGDSITCDDNRVERNVATDTQAIKTQAYGLHIASPLCNRTVVGPANDFTGNAVGPFRDSGTNTQQV